MNNISIFEFESQSIRFVDGKPVANDVATVLGYADPAKAVSTKVKDKNKSVTKMVTVDRKLRDITVLEEAGIYQLIFSSRLPAAEKFQDWVFEEVLPSIRKTGSYSASKQKLGAYTQRVEAMFDAANKIPDGYWCVLHESANLLIWVEQKLKYPVDKADLLDGSIGIHWSKHREGKDWIGDRIKFKYRFPDGRHCDPWCYRMRELEHFRYFLEQKYKPTLLPQYLESKYPSLVKVS
ncbi:MAG: Bro-N domain-containing protein [Dolichospermum sp.]